MLVKESDTIEQKINTSIARAYKWLIDKDYLEDIDDFELSHVAKGGYINDYGFEGVDEGYKPYYEYLKQDLEIRKNNIYEEYNNEQLLLEDNNYNNTNIVQYEYIPQQYNYSYDYNNYYTPYSYEYDPYIDYYNNGYNNTYYNDTVNTTVDLTNTNTFNDSITNILDMIKSYNNKHNIFNSINNTKKKIITYISNYRPMYNSITNKIEAVLIE